MKTKFSLENDIEITSSSPDDPRMKKRWGFISALPSEYLIHFRKGVLSEKTSGQGASCFKLWNDTTFIIPTSFKEIIFEANQLTQDNVDVRIRGMAVYRISDPMRIYRLINFSNRQRAEEKLARMFGDMCRSTSKWLVANMNVDECIRKRKEDIAESLKEEVSLVVADDESGWGVEIITIDIQDVYIQDQEIFDAMQMMFKSEKIRESRLAQMEMKRDLETKKLKQDRELAEERKITTLEKDKIEGEIKNQQMKINKEIAVKKLEQDRELAEHQKMTQLNEAKNQAEITDEKIKLSRQNEEKQFELDRYRVEQNQEIAQFKFEQEAARDLRKMELNLEKTQKEVEAQNLIHQEEARALSEKIQAENNISRSGLEKHFMEKALPSIAEAMAKNMNDVKINMFQQDGEGKGSPFNFILMDLMEIFQERMKVLKKEDSALSNKK